MKKPLENIAQEISDVLVAEMQSGESKGTPDSPSLIHMLVDRLADEVVKQIRDANSGKGMPGQQLATGLVKSSGPAKRKRSDDDDDDDDASASRFPNLKYAKPKYQDVESILRYIESDEGKGGVKLVIMNFND